MGQVLRLTVLTGPHRNQRFCFRGTAQCLIGRAPECFVQFAGTEKDQYISRRHCQLVLNDSSLTLRDLHSTTGTYLGGKKIDSVALSLPCCDGCAASTGAELEQGSLLTIGGTTLRLHMVECATEASAGEMPALWDPAEFAKKHCPLQCSDSAKVVLQ
jgi:pSer/pThr/pTyr-binding forkhead associated (FHA) protein